MAGHTPSGTALGTPCYMAPEQVLARTRSVGSAADIYALGSILYELLAGRPPFDGETPIAIMGQLLHDEPLSPARLRPRLPADLVTICLKCLEKSPRRRYLGARELADDLRRYRSGEPIHARPLGAIGRAYRWWLRRPLVAGLLSLLVALTAAFVVTVIVYEIQLTDALKQSQAEVREERQQIVDLNLTIGALAMDDGDTFLAVLYYSEVLRLDEGSDSREPIDRARIAAALRRCPRLVQVVTHDGPVIGVHLDPSGGWGATMLAGNALEVWNVPTGRVIAAPMKLDEVLHDVALSSNGRWLAVIGSTGKTRVWDLLTGKPLDLPEPDAEDARLVAFPPGDRTFSPSPPIPACRSGV